MNFIKEGKRDGLVYNEANSSSSHKNNLSVGISSNSSEEDEEAFKRINKATEARASNSIYPESFIRRMTKNENNRFFATVKSSRKSLIKKKKPEISNQSTDKERAITLPFVNFNLEEFNEKIVNTTQSILNKCNTTHLKGKEIQFFLQEEDENYIKDQTYLNFKDSLKHSLGKRFLSVQEERDINRFDKPKNLKNAGTFVYFGKDKNLSKRYISTDENNTLSKSEAIGSISSVNAFKFKEYLNSKFNIGIDKNDVFGLKNERKGINIKDKILINPNRLKIPENKKFAVVEKLLDDGIRKKISLEERLNKFQNKLNF